MLRIFTSEKIQLLRPGLNPQTWVPEASMLTTIPPKPSSARVTWFIFKYSVLTNKVKRWYVRHNLFIVLNHSLHVSTYIQVIFRPPYVGKYSVLTAQ